MSNPIKKFFNGKKWNNVKTRKIMLVMSVFMVVIYTVVAIVLLVHRTELNDQLTIEYFGYAKWLVATGGIITVAKVCKGNTNSDDNES